MKQFFISLSASVLGGVIVIFLMIFFFIGLAASSNNKKELTINDGSFLKLDINGVPLRERTQDSEYAKLSELLGESTPIGLAQVVQSIRHASTNDKIEGILLHSGVFIGGAAAASEIRDALTVFKESGKPIYGYGDFYSSRGLYVSSIADSLFLNPAGLVDWTGLNLSVMYYKGMLDKIGVKAEAIRGSNNKFKSAVEPYIEYEMSSSNRLQLKTLAGDLWTNMLEVLSEERALSQEELQMLADSLKILDADDVLEYHLCDQLMFKDQWDSFLNDKLHLDKDKNIVSLKDYSTKVKSSKRPTSRNKIAVLYIDGEFTSGDGNDVVDAGTMVKALKQIRENDNIKALILRVNSPGGQAWIAEQMVREIELVREEIPVVVSMGNLAASAGYMVSCLGDSVFAQSNTITGSIGVFGLLFQAEELLEDKMGLKTFHINTAAHANMGTPDRALDDYERQILQTAIDNYYGEFIQLVASNRDLDSNFVDSIGQGRVWSGIRALELGLVDAIGGMEEAMNAAVAMADLDEGDFRVVAYPKFKDPVQELLEKMGSAQLDIKEVLPDSKAIDAIEFLSKWEQMEGKALMKMEMEIEVE